MSSSYDSALVDTAMIEDPRLLKLPRGIRHLHTEALVWSKLRRTDGFIPAGALSRLTDEPEPRKAARELVRVGLWDLTADGWRIADFLDTQMSAARVQAKQESARERYDRWLDKQAQRVSKRVSNGADGQPARPPAKAGKEGGGNGAGQEPAPAALEVDHPSIPAPTRRDLARMIRKAPNPSLRDAYLSAFRKTFGTSYPDGRGHTILHRSMRTMVREGQVAA